MFNFLTIKDLLLAKNQILEEIKTNHYILVNISDTSNMRNDFVNLNFIFGKILHHTRSENSGIAVVAINKDPMLKDFKGANNSEHFLHTDGMYGKIPKIMALQCQNPAQNGGESCIVLGQNLFNYLSESIPSKIENLFETDFFRVARAGEESTKPLFSYSKSSKITISFRKNDGFAKVICKYPEIYGMILDYLENRNNQVTFTMKKGDILIADNTAVLHGRTPFQNSKNNIRIMNRLWFEAEELDNGFKSK